MSINLSNRISDNTFYTLIGGIAILLWSCGVTFARALTEQLGPLTTASIIYIIAGLSLLSVGHIWGAPNGFRERPITLRGFACGVLFCIYIFSFYTAVGGASSRINTAYVGLINYLWPSFAILFGVPLLGYRSKLGLFFGVILATFGASVVVFWGGQSTIYSGDFSSTGHNAWSYLFALLGAISWGLFCALRKRWAGMIGDSLGQVFLSAGVVSAFIAYLNNEVIHFSLYTLFEIVVMLGIPLGYLLWDLGIRKGNYVLLMSASYLIPVLSVLIVCLYFHLPVPASLFVGACLIAMGSYICQTSVNIPEKN